MCGVERSDKEARIVITGATGILGSYLTAHLLREGYTDITVAVRSEKSLSKLASFLGKRDFGIGAVNVVFVSLFDMKALAELFRGCDIIYNCAAVVSLDEDSSQNIIEDNVRMAYNIAEAAYSAQVGKFVHVSTIATLSARAYPEMTTEDSHMITLRDKSPYGIGKFFAENEVWRLSQKGLKAVVVNPAVILGEGDWYGSGTPAMFRYISRVTYFYTDGVTGYVSANDTARFMERLAFKKEAVGKRFVLCGENLSYKELITYINESFGKKEPVFRIGSGVVKFLEKGCVFLRKMRIRSAIPPHVFRNLREKASYDGTYAEGVAGIKYTPIRDEIKIIGETYIKDTKN